MARLVRLDRSGNTELAAWSEEDHGSYELAAAVFREQLAGGYMGVAKLPDDTLRAGEGTARRRRPGDAAQADRGRLAEALDACRRAARTRSVRARRATARGRRGLVARARGRAAPGLDGVAVGRLYDAVRDAVLRARGVPDRARAAARARVAALPRARVGDPRAVRPPGGPRAGDRPARRRRAVREGPARGPARPRAGRDRAGHRRRRGTRATRRVGARRSAAPCWSARAAGASTPSASA